MVQSLTSYFDLYEDPYDIPNFTGINNSFTVWDISSTYTYFPYRAALPTNLAFDPYFDVEYEGEIYKYVAPPYTDWDFALSVLKNGTVTTYVYKKSSFSSYYIQKIYQTPSNEGLCTYRITQTVGASKDMSLQPYKTVCVYTGSCYVPSFIKFLFSNLIVSPDLSNLQQNSSLGVREYIVDDIKKSTTELQNIINSILTGVYVQSITDVYTQLPKTFDYKDFTYTNPLDVQEGDYLVSYIYLYTYKTVSISSPPSVSWSASDVVPAWDNSIKGTIKYPYLHTKIKVKRKTTKCCLKACTDKSYLLIK